MARKLSIVIVALATLGLGTAAEAGRYGEVIAKKSARGDYAIVNAAGRAKHPSAMYVRVSSKPRQRFSGSWLATCSKGTGAGSKDGNFGGMTAQVERVKLPMSNPDDCILSAGGQLKDGGKITVKLFAK